MDLNAAAAAASQIAAGQRAQQGGFAAIRQQNIQAQTFVSLIAQAAGLGKTDGARAPAPVTAEQKNNSSPDQKSPEQRLPRGSLVNILA